MGTNWDARDPLKQLDKFIAKLEEIYRHEEEAKMAYGDGIHKLKKAMNLLMEQMRTQNAMLIGFNKRLRNLEGFNDTEE